MNDATGFQPPDAPLERQQPYLRRSVGPFQLFALAIGVIIGSVRVVLIGDLVKFAAPVGALLGFSVGGLVMILVAKPWRQLLWCIGELTAEYRRRMYELLDLYARPHDPREPVICLDEKSKQLLRETHRPLPAKPATPAKEDYQAPLDAASSGLLRVGTQIESCVAIMFRN